MPTFLQRISFSFLLLTSTLLADDWPQWRGPHRNGRIDSDVRFTESTEVKKLWRANVGTGFSSMVITDEMLVTMGNVADEDIVTCLNATTGIKQWEYRYGEPLDANLFEGGPTSTPAITAGIVFTISRQGLINCFDLKSGELRWNYDIVKELKYNVPSWGFAGSPLVVKNRLYLNAGSHGICLNTENGSLVWSSSNDVDAGYSSPLIVNVDGKRLILVLNAKALSGVDFETGELLWSQRWITRYGINASDPLILENQRLIISSGYGKGTGLVKFDAESAELLWRVRDVRTQMSPGVLVNKSVFAIDGDEGDDPRLVCFDPESGEILWSEEDFGAGSMIVINKQILVLSETGELIVFKANSSQFKPILKVNINAGRCWTHPVIVGRRLYSKDSSGEIVCSIVQ